MESFFLLRYCLCLFFLVQLPLSARAQQTAPYNRFQYHKYTWKVLPTEAFRIYFPRGYDSLASFCLGTAA